MSTMIRTFAISLLIFMLPIVAYEAYKILIIGNCDPKFGCWGPFEFTLLISSAYCFISLTALISAQLISKTNMINVPSLLVTLLLGTAHRFVLSIDFLDSLTTQILFWLVLSGVLYSLAALISKKYNKQRQPTCTRSCFERYRPL